MSVYTKPMKSDSSNRLIKQVSTRLWERGLTPELLGKLEEHLGL